VDSSRPLTAETRVRIRVSPCGICSGQTASRTGISPSSLVFPCQYHCTVALHAHVSHGGMNNRPAGECSSSAWTRNKIWISLKIRHKKKVISNKDFKLYLDLYHTVPSIRFSTTGFFKKIDKVRFILIEETIFDRKTKKKIVWQILF
jgi:hypothetical protein